MKQIPDDQSDASGMMQVAHDDNESQVSGMKMMRAVASEASMMQVIHDDDASSASGMMRVTNDDASSASGMMQVANGDDASSVSGMMRVAGEPVQADIPKELRSLGYKKQSTAIL